MDYVENLAGVADCSKGHNHAVCDATDMQKLTLLLPFLLHGLADVEIQRHNDGSAAADRIINPIPGMIACWNDYLRWYHLYRQRESNEPALQRLDATGILLLENLKATFPYLKTNGTSGWCTEKIHSILHAKENIERSGRCRNWSTQVTETKHKSIKDKCRMTNNQHSIGFSLLHSELKADAAAGLAAHMARQLRKRGVLLVTVCYVLLLIVTVFYCLSPLLLLIVTDCTFLVTDCY
jgi:hypothetical protein